MKMKPYLRRIAAASITDEDVHLDPARAFHVALATARAAFNARAASVDTHPKGGDGEAAPFMSGAVPEGQTPRFPHLRPNPSTQSTGDGE